MLLSSSFPSTLVRIKFLALLQKRNNTLVFDAGSQWGTWRQNHVSVTPSIIKNVDISEQWTLLEITLGNKRKLFSSAHRRPFVMVLKHMYSSLTPLLWEMKVYVPSLCIWTSLSDLFVTKRIQWKRCCKILRLCQKSPGSFCFALLGYTLWGNLSAM